MKNKCYTHEARCFENKLNEIGITFAQYNNLYKMYCELSMGGKCEVADMLGEYENNNKENMLSKKSITNLLEKAGFKELICTSFEEARENDRKKNIVILDDADIYLTYKYNNKFGEFVSWPKEEFEIDSTVYEAVVQWAKTIYCRDDIDRCIEHDNFFFKFEPYDECEYEQGWIEK